MKRSSINKYIDEASAFFSAQCFYLPPFATWTPDKWARCAGEASEFRNCRLGWDVTDFNSEHFESVGLTLFTLRNDSISSNNTPRTYAEKIMFVRENQVTPYHYHACKTEDIINRGGRKAGRLAVQLYGRTENGECADCRVSVNCDGIRREVEPGQAIILGPGESITLTPYLYHMFYAVDGDALIGEVSSRNDDDTDNYFKEALPRYPGIVEDEVPLRLLCNEYPVVSEA